MSASVVTAVRLCCDFCNRAQFTGQVFQTTETVRVVAAAEGWSFGTATAPTFGGRGQRHYDWCPGCPDPRPVAVSDA